MGGDLLLLIATIGPLVLFGWAAVRAKHHGLGGSFAGPFQEMFDPGAARAQIVLEERAELPDPGNRFVSSSFAQAVVKKPARCWYR
ncbi:hypothetical protein [Nocardia rhamnosiphila]|uniref:Uncharacterized protein n=1 Tax=Nocardia rhamnosiphila TaxID=426716 RepID=A0ABV2WV26_9NOCA